MLTTKVTITVTLKHHMARYMFSAISLASGENATYRSALGSSFTHAHKLIEVTVPSNSPQNPPALVARFQNMPSRIEPSSGAMKKLKSACT